MREAVTCSCGSHKKAQYCGIGFVDGEGMGETMGFVIDRVWRWEMKEGRGALKVSGFCPGLTSEG